MQQKIKWPKFSETEFRQLLKRRKVSGGASAAYIKWNNRVGLKLFADVRNRNSSVRRQRKAAKHGLAPRVGDLISIETFHFQSASASSYSNDYCSIKVIQLFGFFTEHASGVGNYHADSAVAELEENLRKIRINHPDLHDYNVGWINRKLVCIDFDNISMS